MLKLSISQFRGFNKHIYHKKLQKKFYQTFVNRPGDSVSREVTLIPGEGIGQEIADCVLKVNKILNPPIEWNIINNFSFETSNYLKNECILKGPHVLKSKSKISEHVVFAKKLNLFAHVVHSYTMKGVNTRHNNVDIVVIRENTEGEFSGLEHEVYPGVIESIKVITENASRRLAEYAFEYAYLNGRKKVTAVHKANIMYLNFI